MDRPPRHGRLGLFLGLQMMGSNDAILISKQSTIEFEDDDLDWLIGELDHAIDEAKERGLLLYQRNAGLALAARGFFRRYHQRLVLGQMKPDFESVRISDEEWNRRCQDKIRRFCSGVPDTPSAVPPLPDLAL